MICKYCKTPAVISGCCEKHYPAYFERRVLATIRKHKLMTRKDRIAVACSGGKDSTAVLHVLSRKFPRVTAIAIDEGIRGYRKKTLAFLKSFCAQHGITLVVVDAKKELGRSLDATYSKTMTCSACTICGALRRKLLNSAAMKLGATVLATGHNMDDEAQSVMMNIFRNTLRMSARLGPKSGLGKVKGFVRRVKPLYHTGERESFAYCHMMGFDVPFAECPYAKDSYRAYVRGLLNDYEASHPGTKANIIRSFVKMLPKLKAAFKSDEAQKYCSVCGSPSAKDVCRICLVDWQRLPIRKSGG
jgi:tRNA-5-methyluridine54 2-sulfurtransferase